MLPRQTTTLQVLADAIAAKGADHPLIDFLGATLTLGDLDGRSDALARGLIELGARAGDCITSLLDNGFTQIELMFAVHKVGAIHVPLNTAYKGEYLKHQVNDSRAVILVAERDYAERILAIENELSHAQILLVCGEASDISSLRLTVSALSSVVRPAGARILPSLKPSDLALLIYTAGTTGPSKGCMVSHNYVCNLGRLLTQMYVGTADDVIWTPLPGFHMNQIANLLCAMLLGARIAIYPRFSVTHFWKEVVRTRATITTLLGAMLAMIADAPEDEWTLKGYGQIRVAGGVPFPLALQERWRKRFGVQHIGDSLFGLTECANLTQANADEVRPATCAGRINDSFDVRIVDEEDREVSAGTPGEIVVRPKLPHVMFEGFWGRPQETLGQLRNLWYHTGDIGKFDADGWFYFVDRKKDYLRRRGENVSTLEMEGVFRKHPAVADVAVHAVKSDMTEDEIKVTVVPARGNTTGEEALCIWSIGQLPYFAVPRYIEFRTELPRNPVGRVLKYELREQGVTATTWDRERSGVVVRKR